VRKMILYSLGIREEYKMRISRWICAVENQICAVKMFISCQREFDFRSQMQHPAFGRLNGKGNKNYLRGSKISFKCTVVQCIEGLAHKDCTQKPS